ncbi:DHHC palmitoyltransferase-domain-containing protein [Gautieria morchelliformis]|nr:DHHC palmitoyltransferase-domain-containing protein [Gautieria morchelliformis]
MPLLAFDRHPSDSALSPASTASPPAPNSATQPPRKGWLTYAPLVVLFTILFIPQPSFILALTSFYLRAPQTESQPTSEPHSHMWPFSFFMHLLVVEVLTLAAVGAAVVCVGRDPGRVAGRNTGERESGMTEERNRERNKKKNRKSTKGGVTRVHDADDTVEGVTTSLLRGGRASYESADGAEEENGGWALAGDRYDHGLGARDEYPGMEDDGGFDDRGWSDWAGDLNGNGFDAENQLDEDSSGQAQVIQDRDLETRTNTWCATCNIRRPERAHHCGICRRCVVKMDHHCPWLGGCIGHRTYPAFIHFLLTSTLLAAYITAVAFVITAHYVRVPEDIVSRSPGHLRCRVLITPTHPIILSSYHAPIGPPHHPLHALFLLLMGAVFTLTMGAFLGYHVFLVS